MTAPSAGILRIAPAAPNHLVQFYETDAFLVDRIVRFLGAGLAEGEAVLLIATPAHRGAVRARLEENGFAVERLIEDGRLVLLDTLDTLAAILVDGSCDGARFRATVGRRIEELVSQHPTRRVRAFGEMVDVLWRDGAHQAAIGLEQHWNELALRHHLTLLCAYGVQGLDDGHEAATLADVSRVHSSTLPSETSMQPSAEMPRSMLLDEQARALDGEERIRLFLQSVKDYAIFVLDPGGHVASWSAGAERIKGYTEREIVGKHFSIFYPREDVEAGKCEFELEVAGREGRFEDEGWRLRKDGTRFWANVVITAVHDDHGRLVGFGKVTRDLTARIEVEQERLRRVRAEEGEQRREEFLSVMSHELRNPLSAMVMAVHLVKLRRGVRCDREIAVLERQTSMMKRLLDDLLDVSRTLRDKVQLSPKAVEIADVLANAIDVSSPLIEQRGHLLRLDLAEGSLLVDVDPQRMAQVFSNLLNNAAKYTDPGGEIRLSAYSTGHGIEVVVGDTGIGIEPELKEHLFELFAQGAHQADRQLGGFGIGLAVAKRLVNEHGGEIDVESVVGRGSRFIVRLPRSKATAPDSASPSSSPSSSPAERPGEHRRVLLVDDNGDSIDLMSVLLKELGHDVAVAEDGTAGLALAREFQPDIAFLDLGLPGISGCELVRQMRQIPACARIPIIAVSGHAREGDRADAIRAGFSEHFAKPIDLGRLEQCVAGACAND